MEIDKLNSLVELYFKKCDEVDPDRPFLKWLKPGKATYSWGDIKERVFKLSSKIQSLIKECKNYKIESVLLSRYVSLDQLIHQIDFTKPKTISCSYHFSKYELQTLRKTFKRLKIGISINPENFNLHYIKNIKNLINVIYFDMNVYKKRSIKTYSLNKCIKQIKSIKNNKTKEFPGIPTDLQAQLMVLMCKAKGKSSITEKIFENRFMHVAELQRLGANITTKNNKAYIEGNTKFIGAEVMSSDLRASVALVLAASVAQGKSVINRIYHLDRGYEKIENKLKNIGVKIKRLKR